MKSSKKIVLKQHDEIVVKIRNFIWVYDCLGITVLEKNLKKNMLTKPSHELKNAKQTIKVKRRNECSRRTSRIRADKHLNMSRTALLQNTTSSHFLHCYHTGPSHILSHLVYYDSFLTGLPDSAQHPVQSILCPAPTMIQFKPNQTK